MTTLTLAVPQKLKKEMEKFPEINWSEVARQAFLRKLDDLEFLRKLSVGSSMTPADAVALGRAVDREVARRHRERHGPRH